MLVIRREQMDALKRYMWAPYIEHLVGEIRQHFPTHLESMSERGVCEFVVRVIEKGGVYGVDTGSDLAVLAQLMFTFGEAFERSPDQTWAESVLTHSSLTSQVKVELMREHMIGCPAVLKGT